MRSPFAGFRFLGYFIILAHTKVINIEGLGDNRAIVHFFSSLFAVFAYADLPEFLHVSSNSFRKHNIFPKSFCFFSASFGVKVHDFPFPLGLCIEWRH